MKTLLNSLLFITCLAFFWACQPGTNDSVNTETEMVTNNPLDTIPLQVFNNWVNNWAKHDTGYIDTTAITYFNMPIIDLKGVLGENADSARLYIGLQKLAPHKYEPHIMMVGMENGAENLNLIFDYSTTCPPWCDGAVEATEVDDNN